MLVASILRSLRRHHERKRRRRQLKRARVHHERFECETEMDALRGKQLVSVVKLTLSVHIIRMSSSYSCDCVQKIISLSIQTVHKSVEEFKVSCYGDEPSWCGKCSKMGGASGFGVGSNDETRHSVNRRAVSGDSSAHKELLKCGAKVLHSLHFKAADLMCKYETDYNKLKFIIKSLKEFKSALGLTDRDGTLLQISPVCVCVIGLLFSGVSDGSRGVG